MVQLQHKYFYECLQNENNDNIDVTELLRESIYRGKGEYLSYYVNVLITRQLVEEVFAILRKMINQNTLKRRDSGYDSDLESEDQYSLHELEHESNIESAEETEQCSINEAIKIIISTLINAGINIGTYKYETVETLLHSASSIGNTEIVNFLIEKGIDVNLKNNRGTTALHFAVISDHFDIVKVLISAKARVNEQDKEGNTALHFAVSCEADNIAELLLQSGANPNTFCPLGDDLYIQAPELQDIKCTSLQLAAFIGNLDIIELLIKHGADVNAVCKNKRYSCLHMAVLGVTCYYDAGISEKKEEEYLKVVGSFISQFPNQINNQDHEDNAPLHLAVSTKHEKIIRVLLKHGASALAFRKGGYTAFHDAIAGGNLSIVKLLLESSDKKAKLINSIYKGDGFSAISPMHLAISAYIEEQEKRSDCLTIIKYLLSYPDLNINVQDFNGETPLHYAIKYIKDDELALTLINELLTARNINLFIKDCTRKTPFNYARESSNKILQELIQHKCDDGNSLLHLATGNGDVKAVEYLIKDQKFDVNSQNDSEITPLQLAASKGFIDIVRILINNGAVDVSAQPAAYRAILKGRLDIADLLLISHINNKERVDYCFRMSIITIEQIYAHDSIDENKSQESVQARQMQIDRLIRAICHLVNSYPKLDINTIFDNQKKTALHYAIKSKLDIDSKLKLLEILSKRKDINPFIKDAENKTPIDYYIEQKKYNSSTLDQYAKIQKDRSAKIESHNAKKHVISAIALFMINAALIGLYVNQYPLEIISDQQSLGLSLMVNVVVCSCCYIISKCVEKSIEEKYKNKISDLFNVKSNDEVSTTLEGIFTQNTLAQQINH